MELVLTTFGTYLHRKGEMFAIRLEGNEQEVAARKVRTICIATGASLSTDAIQLALENNIDIIFLDKYGDPYGRVWHGRPGSTTAIRRAQLRMADTAAGTQRAIGWTLAKLDNQVGYFMDARERRTRLSAQLTVRVESLRALRERLAAVTGDLDTVRFSVLGLEGQAGAVHWEAVNLLLPESCRFVERSRNPAKDSFNCLLNYAYGVLYGTVERACVLAGLDPYVGFIHTDHYQKKSLVFDLIEQYRIWADAVVIELCVGRKVTDELFDKLQNGLVLNKQGKAVLMERFGAYLDEGVRYRNRNIKRRDTVQLDCHRLAQELLEMGE